MAATASSSYSTYEEEHIDFVSSENGTTSGEVSAMLTSFALLPFLASLIFPWFVPSKLTLRCGQDPLLHTFLRFLIEFPVVVVLPCLLVTCFTSDLPESKVTEIATVTLLATCLLLLTLNHTMTRPNWTSLVNEWNLLKDEDIGWSGKKPNQNPIISASTSNGVTSAAAAPKITEPEKSTDSYPFLTNCRGQVNYMSIICILAVDFPVFPRRFAKTKKYGVSLMDVGTGAFIFANGIVSPEAKNRAPNFKKSFMSSVPLFVLGFCRLIAIKGSKYHEVVEEYGVHWNFFFTLAALKILSTIALTIFSTKSALKLCAAVGVIYEAFLLLTDIQESYLLNSMVDRQASLVNANREGIFSSFGYLVIYLASVYYGQRIFTERKKTFKDWLKHLIELGRNAVVSWTLFYFWHNYGNPSCRRVGNLSYALWLISMVSMAIFTNLFVSIAQSITQKLGILHGPMISYHLYLKNLRETGHCFNNKLLTWSKNRSDISERDSVDDGDDDNNFHKRANKFRKSASASAKGFDQDTDGDEMDQNLNALDEKIEQLSKSCPDGADFNSEEFDKLENELEELERKIVEQEEMENVNDNDEEISPSDIDTNNHVHLPDLTKASLFNETICFNGLIVFLLANLLTGLVNYSILTMYARPILSVLILLCYISALYFTSFLLYWFNIRLKFW